MYTPFLFIALTNGAEINLFIQNLIKKNLLLNFKKAGSLIILLIDQ